MAVVMTSRYAPLRGGGVVERVVVADDLACEVAADLAENDGAAEQERHQLEVGEAELAGDVLAQDLVVALSGVERRAASVLRLVLRALFDLRIDRHGDEAGGHDAAVHAAGGCAVRVETGRPHDAGPQFADVRGASNVGGHGPILSYRKIAHSIPAGPSPCLRVRPARPSQPAVLVGVLRVAVNEMMARRAHMESVVGLAGPALAAAQDVMDVMRSARAASDPRLALSQRSALDDASHRRMEVGTR